MANVSIKMSTKFVVTQTKINAHPMLKISTCVMCRQYAKIDEHVECGTAMWIHIGFCPTEAVPVTSEQATPNIKKDKKMERITVDRQLLINKIVEINKAQDDKYSADLAVWTSEITAGVTKQAQHVQEVLAALTANIGDASSVIVADYSSTMNWDSAEIRITFDDVNVAEFGGKFSYVAKNGEKGKPKDPANTPEYEERVRFLTVLQLSSNDTIELDMSWNNKYLN